MLQELVEHLELFSADLSGSIHLVLRQHGLVRPNRKDLQKDNVLSLKFTFGSFSTLWLKTTCFD